MPIYKRGKKYWIDITSPNGKRIRQSAGTSDKTKAQEYHDKLKYDLWQLDKLDKHPDKIFDEIIILALKDAEGQRSFSNKQTQAKYFLGIFKGRKISTITREEIANSLPIYSTARKRKLSNASKNRYRAFIMRAFSLAHKMGWIKEQLYIPRMREPTVRVRWIKKEQAIDLINNLKLKWMKDLVSLALLTGARQGELLSLTWRNVDLDKGIAIITAENAKSKRARTLPLNEEAVNILKNIPRKFDYIFTRTGKKKHSIGLEDFARAIKLTRLVDFRFHDLRHTWASWHVQNGTPLMVLKEMGGWETLEMVKRYAHLNTEHLSKYSELVTISPHSIDKTKK
ncbi:tyrosine-type recombinase/integrase [Proteus sp. DFP240708]|uniref:Site-specific integrase n=2 Tax=Proteus TaxID=583 RepID=A0A6I7D229_9GAMM|nr:MULTISPECIES: site-specific integrase [Proteus]QHN11071.1 site-specific integrase [Proteus columbae]